MLLKVENYVINWDLPKDSQWGETQNIEQNLFMVETELNRRHDMAFRNKEGEIEDNGNNVDWN